jgi:hypothetical protein
MGTYINDVLVGVRLPLQAIAPVGIILLVVVCTPWNHTHMIVSPVCAVKEDGVNE